MDENQDQTIDLKQFYISETMGFLLEDPLEYLPPYFEPWNELGLNMKEYVPLGEFRNAVDLMPLLDHTRLEGYKQHRLAKVLLSFITAGYVWEEGDQGICKVLPRQVAVPLYHVSRHLGEQPILTHYNFALANYRLIDKTQPFNADNLAELCCFPHPATRWFIAVTCCFEKAAAPGVKACVDAIHAAQTGDVASLTDALDRMCDAIRAVQTAISRMHEKLSASDFFNNVRPFLSGWGGEGNPAPEGIIYEGVSDSDIQCRGGSAGQSSALQCFDTTLGITHSADKEAFMREMRQYMPAPHRSFIQAVQKHSRVRQTVEKLDDEDLSGAYNACVTSLHDLRSYHIRIVTKYIVCPSKSASREKAYDSLATKGTGGSSLMPFLKDIRSTTSKAIIHKV